MSAVANVYTFMGPICTVRIRPIWPRPAVDQLETPIIADQARSFSRSAFLHENKPCDFIRQFAPNKTATGSLLKKDLDSAFKFKNMPLAVRSKTDTIRSQNIILKEN